MARNEEEQGTLILPSAAIIPLRRAFVDQANAERAKSFDMATRVHAHLKSDAGKEDRKALSKVLKQPNARWGPTHAFLADLVRKLDPAYRQEDRAFDIAGEVERLLITRPATKEEKPKVQAPKKKDLPALPAQTWSFSNDDCSVSINPEKRTLHWHVGRNNHAVDHAWESALGRLLSRELSKVKWTRGTGGVFRHSDEYAEDAAMEHGHNAISISHAFGPLGEQEKQAHYGLPARRRSSIKR